MAWSVCLLTESRSTIPHMAPPTMDKVLPHWSLIEASSSLMTCVMLTHKTSQYNMVNTCSLVKTNAFLCWRLLLKQAVPMQGHEIHRKCLKIQPLQETMFAALCDFQGEMWTKVYSFKKITDNRPKKWNGWRFLIKVSVTWAATSLKSPFHHGWLFTKATSQEPLQTFWAAPPISALSSK